MTKLVILGKIELPSTKDILCPVCSKNCNVTGLRVDYLGNLQPCDDCCDDIQQQYWEQLYLEDEWRKSLTI